MAPKPRQSIYHPKYAPTWLTVFMLWCFAWTPLAFKRSLGRPLGTALHRLATRRVSVIRKNLSACFPQLSSQEIEALALESCVETVIAILECPHAWWRSLATERQTLKIVGAEHLATAQARGKGVLLIGGHQAVFDLAVVLLGFLPEKAGYMYRADDNPVLDHVIQTGRQRQSDMKGFTKKDLKSMMDFIREGGTVWYGPDQDFGKKHTAVFVDFFGVPTGCITTPSWIAAETECTVLQIAQYRDKDGPIVFEFSPIYEEFGKDPVLDAETWNHFLEHAVSKRPSQYLWAHKRFKTRPEGHPAFY